LHMRSAEMLASVRQELMAKCKLPAAQQYVTAGSPAEPEQTGDDKRR
jgi:hypothetical protein